MRYWVLSGSIDSWNTSLSKNIWGVRKNLKVFWDKISTGDVIFLYVKKPVSGVIGIGQITKKFRDDKVVWSEETKDKKIIFPYRFNFTIDYVLPKELWLSNNIKVDNLKMNYRKGINPCINKETTNNILKIIESNWKYV